MSRCQICARNYQSGCMPVQQTCLEQVGAAIDILSMCYHHWDNRHVFANLLWRSTEELMRSPNPATNSVLTIISVEDILELLDEEFLVTVFLTV